MVNIISETTVQYDLNKNFTNEVNRKKNQSFSVYIIEKQTQNENLQLIFMKSLTFISK